jgi:hypothetical protein
MLSRILFVVVVLLVVWRLLAAWTARSRRSGLGADSYSRYSPNQRKRRREWARQSRETGPEKLVACSYCGTLVPAGKVLGSGDDAVYCQDSCRERAAAADHSVN